MLESLREVNWIVNYLDPALEPVDVAYEVVAFAGQHEDTVKAACDEALTNYLIPINYRLNEASPATAGGEVIYPPDGATTRQQYIYENELIALLDRCLGVDRVVSVTINGVAGDFLMDSHYSFPEPGFSRVLSRVAADEHRNLTDYTNVGSTSTRRLSR